MRWVGVHAGWIHHALRLLCRALGVVLAMLLLVGFALDGNALGVAQRGGLSGEEPVLHGVR